jgi:lysozyme
MAVPGYNGLIDISHYQGTPSLGALNAEGIVAVICKATEGRSTKDDTYSEKKEVLKPAGIKWGSYHYSSGSEVVLQVENYLNYAKPEPDEFMALDYEPSSSGSNMTYAQMVEFVELVKQETGRYPAIYGGRLLRETLKDIDSSVLSQCPLWYSRYNTSPTGIPKIWPNWTLWQYTDGNVGPQPHSVPGFGRCDRDTFNGTKEQLLQQWPLS